MSLYHEAAKVLASSQAGDTSIKSLVYSKKGWKSDPKTLFALSTEAAKWSEVLSEVVERSGLLNAEKQLTPLLALVLTHDLFLSKRGIALPISHGLHAAVLRHKARLSAELTKARIRRGCSTVDALRLKVNAKEDSLAVATTGSHDQRPALHPRWIRINTVRTTLDEQLRTNFAEYERSPSLSQVLRSTSQILHVDEHIPNLIAVPSNVDITSTQAYRSGQLILQDKASCFPAYLLDPEAGTGDVIDACAAPGNKTTHLAAILNGKAERNGELPTKVIACEKDVVRSQTLEKMVKIAGGDKIISIKAKQDFTKLDPEAKELANVTALLLDPSCSGSGIVGRHDGAVTVHLPRTEVDQPAARGKKRKRVNAQPVAPPTEAAVEEEAPESAVNESDEKLKARLTNLSSFQLRLLQHAMRFPAARRITYSTCSTHAEENEHVTMKALCSDIARERGWRILKRKDQIEEMRQWERRGDPDACRVIVDDSVTGTDPEEVADACIRCEKGSDEGTMGFFVVGFVRNPSAPAVNVNGASILRHEGQSTKEAEDSEWEGFDD